MDYVAKPLTEPRLRRRFMVMFALVMTAFALTLGLSIAQTVRQTNEVEAARSRLAIRAAVDDRIQRIADYAYDNGIWDDAARAVYGAAPDMRFITSAWGSATDSGQYSYIDTLVLFDAAGNVVASYHGGKPMPIDGTSNFAKLAGQLKVRASGEEGLASGLFRDEDHLQLVAISNILPSSDESGVDVPAAGPHWIAIAKRFGTKETAEIGRKLALDGARLSEAPLNANAVRILDPAGRPIASIAWVPPHSAWTAFRNSIPILLLGLGILFAVMTASARTSLRWVGRLGSQAMVDSLSKLPNRRALRNALRWEAHNKRMVALAMLDLDDFKLINDQYGHGVGDSLIRTAAGLLVSVADSDMVVVRLGGDEFAILATGRNATARLDQSCRRLIDILKQPQDVGGRALSVATSIGLVEADFAKIDDSEAMRRADIAMYAAKTRGKRRMAWYDEPLHAARGDSDAIAADLGAAIDKGECSVLYQPIFDARSGQVTGAEALLRWTHPERGEVPPQVFLPIAERIGIIEALGRFVILSAARDLLPWQGMRIALNMSRTQMRSPTFAVDLERRLALSGIPPDRLEVEIREALFLAAPEHGLAVSRELRAMGVSLVLDGFGTGSGALNLLRDVEFAKLKLAPTLVKAAGRDDVARVMLQGAIALAHARGIPVCAQGVETHADATLMRVAGCDELQGWIFAPPVTASELPDIVARGIATFDGPPSRVTRASPSQPRRARR